MSRTSQSSDTEEARVAAANRGVQPTKPEKVGNQEYTHGIIGHEVTGIRAQSENVGTKAGQFADKDYFVDLDGKVSTTPPEQGKLLVAKGDSVTPRIAAALASK